jgi:hypothetical protein
MKFPHFLLNLKAMKKLMPLIIMLFCGAFTNAQSNLKEKTVKVLPSSGLTITGDTNINKFTCVFDTSFLREPQAIGYSDNGSVISFSNARLRLHTKGFDCGSRPINRDFKELIKADEYPEIVLELNKVNLKDRSSGIANICIKIAGKQKYYDVPVAIKTGEVAEFKGRMELNINDFGLKPPKKLFGIIVVKDDIQINFDLKVKK